MSFFAKCFLLTVIPSLIMAMPCPVSSLFSSKPADSVQFDFLRANLLFPRTKVGTSLSLIASSHKNSLNLYELPYQLEQHWKKSVYFKMLKVHEKYNGPQNISMERAANIYVAHLAEAKEIYNGFRVYFKDQFNVDYAYAVRSFRPKQSQENLTDDQILFNRYIELFAKAIDTSLSSNEMIDYSKFFKASQKRTNGSKALPEEAISYAIKRQLLYTFRSLAHEESEPIYLELIPYVRTIFPNTEVSEQHELRPVSIGAEQ